MPTNPPQVATLIARIEAQLAAITFDKDDAASIRAALLAGRWLIEGELWPHREDWQAIRACRKLWDGVLDALLAYRHRACIPPEECRWLCQWQPMPGLRACHFRALR